MAGSTLKSWRSASGAVGVCSRRTGASMIDEQQLRRQIEEVRAGKRSRRAFLREMMALGLSAPFVAQMLAHSGVAMAATEFQICADQRRAAAAR